MVVSLSLVTPGLGADYYAQEGGAGSEENSTWTGHLAQTLGVRGQVGGIDFDRALDGVAPSGVQLINKARLHSQQQNAIESGKVPPQTRAGLDITASAPKSVSIQCLVEGDLRLLQAQQDANRQMVLWMEQHCAQHLAWKDGKRIKQPTGQLLVAQFQHYISRAQDPQLHTHNVVLNLQRHANGQWCCLDNSAFFQNRSALGQIYREALSTAVQKLGYKIEITDSQHGFWELKGFSRPVIEAFSQRSQQIREIAPEDANPALRSWIASHHDRASKHRYEWLDLQSIWKTRLAEYSLQGESNAIQGHRQAAAESVEPAAYNSARSAWNSEQPPYAHSSAAYDRSTASSRDNPIHWFSDIRRAVPRSICQDRGNAAAYGVPEAAATQYCVPEAVERSHRASIETVRNDLGEFAKAVAELERVFAPTSNGRTGSPAAIEPARPREVRPAYPSRDREAEL